MIPHKEIIFFDIKEKVSIDILSSRAIFAKIADLAGLLGLLIPAFPGCSIWPAYKSSIAFSKPTAHFGDFRQYGSRAQNINENLFFDVKEDYFLMWDHPYDQ